MRKDIRALRAEPAADLRGEISDRHYTTRGTMLSRGMVPERASIHGEARPATGFQGISHYALRDQIHTGGDKFHDLLVFGLHERIMEGDKERERVVELVSGNVEEQILLDRLKL